MPQIRKLGHVVLFVRDPMASADWYSDLLGMDVVVRDERIPAAFLSLGRRDHDLAFFRVPDDRDLGHHDVEHVSFEIDGGIDDWKRFHQVLVDKGVQILGAVDHGIAFGVYFLDPDGHHLEVFCQRFSDDAASKSEFARIGAVANPVNVTEAEF